MSETDTPDCPLCMETFEIDDLHFYPCTCGYQICRFCWHRIRTDENGLCPACRKTYTEDPAMYRPLTQDEIQKVKKERKQKDAQHKQKISANRQHLSNIRVIQKHLVFVVGLSNKMADADVLRRPEYFGKYGKIVKIVINPNTNYAGPQGPSASAYVTYTKEQDALKAILSINNSQPPLKIRASLGTTKYCTHYLRNMPCPKADCMYLHEVGDGEASFTKEDMQAGKHQLFEKNLLDNYIASLQQHRKLQKSTSESSDTDQVDNTPSEDWSEDIDGGADSVLPSRASWGTSKENKIIDDVRPNHAVEYPDLDSSLKVSPKSSSPPVPNVVTSSSRNPSENHKEENMLKSHHSTEDKTVFSEVWPTSTESLVNDEAVDNNESASNSWPCINDLGLSDLKINPSDDDLGFDPFAECKSGLEDLMATEKHQGLKSSSQPQPSFRWDSFWSSNYMPNQNPLSMLNSYSLFGAQQQIPPMMSYRPPNMNTYQPSQMLPQNPMQMNAPSAASQFRFMSPQQSISRFPSHQMPLPSFSNHSNIVNNSLLPQQQQQQIQNQHQFTNQYRFPPPQQPTMRIGQHETSAVMTSSVTPLTATIGPSTDNKNWQDGLRALLPNINISFANQQRENKLSTSDSLTEADPVAGNLSSPPPPGFAGLPGLTSVKQTDKAVRPTPPPPPGFNKPNAADIFSPTPGILNLPSSLQISSSRGAVSVVSKPVTTVSSTAHDDPSILWSKVLSDQHKEIDTVSMAFPLPGETIKQSGTLEASIARTTLAQPQAANLTSWNTVVSGNPGSKSSQKVNDDELLKHRTPLQVAAKEGDDASKPQKPSPIFGSQQKQGIKKPTAHVKPLKCSNGDGFTTVQGSRQLNAPQNVNSYTGSRVSELDDFGSDLLLPSSSAGVYGSSEYSVNNTTSKVGGSKKKKRRNKDQVEHNISEVIVGRVEAERPPITILDEERPKKSAKTKKKTGQKPSPPQQRKSPPLLSKYAQHSKSKEQVPTPTIRILKSDGNHSGTTMLSPIQATASCESKTHMNGVHDHEIVSRLTESTEKLLKNVLFETEAIKTNTEQISKDLKSALEKCKESSLSLSDLEKINLLLTPGKLPAGVLDDSDLVDTSDLERQVESARREAKMLEARLNDVIRKNMASELETLKRNTKGSGNTQ